MDKKILYVVNTSKFFVSHRLPLALEAQKQGFKVFVASGADEYTEAITKYGITHINIPFIRDGSSPLSDLVSLTRLTRLIFFLRPSLIHFITLKISFLGVLASIPFKHIPVIYAVSGLGLISSLDKKKLLVRQCFKVFKLGARLILKGRKKHFIFQNDSDQRTINKWLRLADSEQSLLNGSGVDLSCYNYSHEPRDGFVVLLASRLLYQKGILEFVEAARILAEQDNKVDMQLAGPVDHENKSSLAAADLKSINDNSPVTYLGECFDMPTLIRSAHLVCLPSYYGEGLPKVLCEAAACGRPIITTDVAGCRDTVIHGKTGIIIPAQDPYALAMAIARLKEHNGLRLQMGKRATQFARQRFSSTYITNRHMLIYLKCIASMN